MTEETKKEWMEWIKAIIIAVLLAFILRTFFFSTSIVEGVSMDPTLENGERVMFNKIIYYVDEPSYGDIVIINRPVRSYVKRVIGMPGDVVEIRDHKLYINGKQKDQSYLEKTAKQSTYDYGPIKVPEDHYFVMGDNRSISKDSRNGLGFIKESEIIGRTELVVYPFNEWGLTR
ncbi:signal peptidase I [Thalassobacillus pellis]|uniref:signal peptidase I n=1 Tax=Thalassobacillus pellis TaxID=748008 RepID=UPI001960253F|nr:signal peptidase I [Thalassobacillus pellis]MBM7552973.1 signal peptidase I [Thalassobacillus pellis]